MYTISGTVMTSKYTMCIFKALSFSRIPRASSKDFTFAHSARLFAPFPSVYFSFEFPACFSTSLLYPAIVLCRRTFSFVTSLLPLVASPAESYFPISLFSAMLACARIYFLHSRNVICETFIILYLITVPQQRRMR